MALNKELYIDDVRMIGNWNRLYYNGLPEVMDKWENNKQNLYKILGNKIIIESNYITTEISEYNDIEKMYYKFFKECKEFFDAEKQSDGDANLDEFCEFMEKFVRVNGFKENRVINDYAKANKPFNAYNRVFINLSKFSKTFSKFLNNPENIKGLQNLYSTYRQKLKANQAEGKVCLSIHPLDYLTMSDNDNNWTSCHSMYGDDGEGGDFRIGNYNYLADEVTLVAYYITDADRECDYEALPAGVKWNSKKWRCLVHLKQEGDTTVIMYSRQYPYESEILIKELDKMIMDLFKDIEFHPLTYYNNLFETNCLGIVSPNDDDPQSNYYVCNYNDSVHINYTKYTRISKNVPEDSFESLYNFITIGEPIPCFECGEGIARESRDGYCKYCDPSIVYCDICGELLCDGYGDDNDGILIDIDDSRYACPSCYEQNYFECKYCHITFTKCDESDDEKVCNFCYEKFNGKEKLILHIQEVGEHQSNENVLDLIAEETTRTLGGSSAYNYYVQDPSLEKFYRMLTADIEMDNESLKLYIHNKDTKFAEDRYVYGIQYINKMIHTYFDYGEIILIEPQLNKVLDTVSKYIHNYKSVRIVGLVSMETVYDMEQKIKAINPNIEVIIDKDYIYNYQTRDLSNNKTILSPVTPGSGADKALRYFERIAELYDDILDENN